MTTRVTEGVTVSRLRCSHARALLSIILKKKRDCSQSITMTKIQVIESCTVIVETKFGCFPPLCE